MPSAAEKGKEPSHIVDKPAGRPLEVRIAGLEKAHQQAEIERVAARLRVMPAAEFETALRASENWKASGAGDAKTDTRDAVIAQINHNTGYSLVVRIATERGMDIRDIKADQAARDAENASKAATQKRTRDGGSQR